MSVSNTSLSNILTTIKKYVDDKIGSGFTNGIGISISNGTIKAKLKSESKSSLTAANPTSTSNRQYPVQADADGNLSVNVPWSEGSNYSITQDLKSDTKSTLESATKGSTSNREYAVGLDKNSKLSVNVPWTDTTYSEGVGVKISGNTIKASLHDETQSTLPCNNPTSVANRQYPVNLDSGGHLSVNVPWENTSASYSVDTSAGLTLSNNQIGLSTVPVGKGGTGLSSNPSMLTNLGSTSAGNVFSVSPRPGVTGTLPLGNGGTGVTSLASLKELLGVWDITVQTTIPTTGNEHELILVVEE